MRHFVSAVADVLSSSSNQMARDIGHWLIAVSLDREATKNESPPALMNLPTAIGAAETHPLVSLLGDDAMELPWTQGSFRLPKSVIGRIAYVELLGPDGLFRSKGRRFGLYLQSPDTFYPSHLHNAEEIYFILSGAAEWQGGEAEFAPKACGTLIHHPSLLPHATRTEASPLLAIWAWQGDIARESYRIIGHD